MKKLLILVCLCFFLGGCYDAKEPNDIAYVVALGVDNTENKGIYDFSIQFAKTTQISGGSSEEGGKEGSRITEMLNVQAPTIYSGVNIANQIISKKFTLAHTILIVVSEDIAKEGIKNLFDTFGRNSDIRPNIYMAVAKGKAKDYLEAVKPVAEVNPVTYYRLIYESEYGGYVPKTQLRDLYFQLDGTEKENILPLAGVNEKNKKKEEEEKSSQGGEESSGQEADSSQESMEQGKKNQVKINQQGFDFLLKDYEAGNIDADKKNAAEVMGMAVFKGDKMIAKTDSREGLMYNIVTGNYRTGYVSFYSEKTPDIPFTLLLESKRKPKVKVETRTDIPKIRLELYLEGQLMSEAVDYPIENNIGEIEEIVKEETKQAVSEFVEKTAREYESDIAGFGQWAKMNFLTYEDFVNYKWREKFPDAQFEVSVNFSLERIGFIDLGSETKGGE